MLHQVLAPNGIICLYVAIICTPLVTHKVNWPKTTDTVFQDCRQGMNTNSEVGVGGGVCMCVCVGVLVCILIGKWETSNTQTKDTYNSKRGTVNIGGVLLGFVGNNKFAQTELICYSNCISNLHLAVPIGPKRVWLAYAKCNQFVCVWCCCPGCSNPHLFIWKYFLMVC